MLNSGDLKVGDIVKMSKDETVPADMAILDATERSFNISTIDVDGRSVNLQKECLKLTYKDASSRFKDRYTEFRKFLNGKVDYFTRHHYLNGFEGLIRLRTDPKGERITNRNILSAGTKLSNINWLVRFVFKANKGDLKNNKTLH